MEKKMRDASSTVPVTEMTLQQFFKPTRKQSTMKTLSFTLSMPNRASWNGRWSGQDDLYCITRSYKDDKADTILSKSSYYYGWSDGWGASVSVAHVDQAKARQLRKSSKGFCGYDWMIDSIERHGKIYASHEEPESETTASVPAGIEVR